MTVSIEWVRRGKVERDVVVGKGRGETSGWSEDSQ